jgi:hypothetical protein
MNVVLLIGNLMIVAVRLLVTPAVWSLKKMSSTRAQSGPTVTEAKTARGLANH